MHTPFTLHPLHSADGSATYTTPTHSITCGVNYPLEVAYRSRELPESTYIEISLRPHNAVASVREHHYESILTSFLTSVILGHETPRTMLQATLQVTQVVEDETLPGGVKGTLGLDVLAGAANALIAACLDAGVQMRTVAGCAVVALTTHTTQAPNDQSMMHGYETGRVTASGLQCVLWPSVAQRKAARSLHVFGFGRQEECFLVQSEGRFSVDEFEMAENLARWCVLERYDSTVEEMRRAVEARVEQGLKRIG